MILEARRLNKWYGGVIALNDVSVSIAPGITGLLGPNGAGKTSLLRIAIGLMRASAGEIRVLDQDPWNNRELNVRIGYAPEHDGLYGWMTGRAFVTSMARLRGVVDARAAADRAIERLGMEDFCARPIRTYSRGMRQRLKLAQAIVHEPGLLVLDEPLTGCDPLVRHDLIAFIRSLPSEGRSVIVSSHVLHEVEAMTSRVVLVHRGRLVADGEVPEIRALIDRHPHTVRIKTDRPRKLAAALATEGEVVELRIEEDGLSVRTPKPDIFYSRLPEIALERGCPVSGIDSPDDNLEAVFRYLTER